MESIKTYLDNLFAHLPKTSQLLDLKSNILSNMEKKYTELQTAGKSESEAKDIVLSEFGNIDELIEEFGFATPPVNTHFLSLDEVNAYLLCKKKMAHLFSLGIVLCILAISSYLLIQQLIADGYLQSLIKSGGSDITGLIFSCLFIIIAACLFIYGGIQFSDTKRSNPSFYQNGISLHPHIKLQLNTQEEQHNLTFMKSFFVGIFLCIFSLIPLFLDFLVWGAHSSYPLVAFLCSIAIGLYILIYYGLLWSIYSRLLDPSAIDPETNTMNPSFWLIAPFLVFLATIFYLIRGLCFQSWATDWFVFPLAGILICIFSMFVSYKYRAKHNN